MYSDSYPIINKNRIMKYSIFALSFCFLAIIQFTSCDKDIENLSETVEPNVQTPPVQRISSIKHDGTTKYRYYYENDKLAEVQSDFLIYDEEADSSILRTHTLNFEYENDKLVRCISPTSVIDISYAGDDLIVSNFHSDFPEATLTYKNYEDSQNMRLEHYLTEGIEVGFSPSFDSNNNFLYAENDIGVDLYEAHPGFNYFSQYYGAYSYNENINPVSDFDREVQLLLYQKIFNNCTTLIERGYKRTEYNYEFDENMYPVSSSGLIIYPESNDTIPLIKKEYIYE